MLIENSVRESKNKDNSAEIAAGLAKKQIECQCTSIGCRALWGIQVHTLIFIREGARGARDLFIIISSYYNAFARYALGLMLK